MAVPRRSAKSVKSYPLSVLSEDTWKQIDFFFWRFEIPCIQKGATGDGFLAEFIETNKRGVEISGVMTFLDGNASCFDHRMILCLSRPLFSSVESVTPEKVANGILHEAFIEGDVLYVTIS